MKLSEFKNYLTQIEKIIIQLEDGTLIPEHFHITEIGVITKNFIDCGGTIRNEKNISMQLWNENDFEHRLIPTKLLNIINISEEKLSLEDLNIEVEYQQDTIGKYGLEYKNNVFILTRKNTDCLAKDNCGIPLVKTQSSICTPGGGCC